LEERLGALSANGLAAGQTCAGEEDLLMESQARSSHEYEARHCDGIGLAEVRDDRRTHSFQRSVPTPERGAEAPRRPLEQRRAQMHVDDIGVFAQDLWIERDRAR